MFFGLSALALLVALFCDGGVVCDDFTINNEESFIKFSDDVNKGSSYSGTIALTTDLDFNSLSQEFQPIGNTSLRPFNGAFDGQGHIIKNLKISSTSGFVGLFGYSSGATIKNIVLEKSCSVVGFSSNSNSDVGSIVGYCVSCSIENVVNMASITFTGDTGGLRIGGIVAGIHSPNTVRNCVNYGSVTYSGTTSGSHIGGIVGSSEGNSPTNSIQNCANYGTLIRKGTLTNLDVGGIVGNDFAGTNIVENCVSAGNLPSITLGGSNKYIGSIVGYISGDYRQPLTISHCLWTSDVGCNDIYGGKYESATVTVTNSNLTTLDTTAMDDLNEYTEQNSTWDKWFMLHLMGGTINSFPQGTMIVTQKHFPDPVKEGSTFSFWCMDAECTGVYDPNTINIKEITDLYAGWNVYTVAFKFGNRTTVSKNVLYGKKYGTLPDAGEKTGYSFVGWFTGVDGSGGKIENETTVSIADDHDLYAHWTINNYTLRFIFDNGESDVVKTLNYSDPIDYPKNLTREGYIINGWSNNITTMPAHNLNVTAQWTINNYTLRFIFNNGENDVIKTLNYSDPIDYPNDPLREGYSFSGWSENITTMPAHNHNITAQWTINNYTLIFIPNNGENDTVETLNYGDPIYYPKNLTKDGYSFVGWSENITTMPAHNLNITAQWTINNYTVTFILDNDAAPITITLKYKDAIDYPKNTKLFYRMKKWCTSDNKCESDHKKVPAYNLTFYSDLYLRTDLVVGVSVGSFVCVLLIVAIVVLVVIVSMVRNGMTVGHESVDIEVTMVMKTKDSGEEDVRIIHQMALTKISGTDIGAALVNNLNNDSAKSICEIAGRNNIDYDENSYDDVESFKNIGIYSAVASAMQTNTNFVFLTEYLKFLYTAVRDREKFRGYKKLYFGMKDVNGFKENKSDTISFGCIVSALTHKKKVIQLLSMGEENDLPRGVLVKVQKGKGYAVTRRGDVTKEVLFEINSLFKVEHVEEVIKGRYFVAKVSFVSPNSKSEKLNF